MNNTTFIEIYAESELYPKKSVELKTYEINGAFSSDIKVEDRLIKSFKHKNFKEYNNFLERNIKEGSIKSLNVISKPNNFTINLTYVLVNVKEINISSKGILIITDTPLLFTPSNKEVISKDRIERYNHFNYLRILYSNIADNFLSTTYYDLNFLIK